MIDAALVLIALLALGVLLAPHWPRPVLLVDPPKQPCGFMPNS